MPYNKFPAVDENNNFPPLVVQALLATMTTQLIPKDYKFATMSDSVTKYPVGVSNFITDPADGWGAYYQIITIKSTMGGSGGTVQISIPYMDETLPMRWRMWKYNATVWGPWRNIAATDSLTKTMVGLPLVDNVSVVADYVAKWKPSTVYAVGIQVVTPSNKVLISNVAHTSSITFVSDVSKWDGEINVPYGHMGKTNGFQQLSGSGAIVIMDAAQELRGGMTFDNATDSLVIPVTGRYRAHVRGYFSGTTSGLNVARLFLNGVAADSTVRGGVLDKVGCQAVKTDSGDIYHGNSAVVPLTVGDKVALGMYSGVSAWGTNGYNGSYLEIEYVGGP